MIKKINNIDGVIQWSELVGLEVLLKDYKIMCIGYNRLENKLLIAEYRTDRNYTNEIVTIDIEKTLSILKVFNINIELINKFCWSTETINKVRGLQQAGFTYIVYNTSTKTSLLEGEMEICLFDTKEKEYIENKNIDKEIKIELSIIN